MSGILCPSPRFQALDANGNLLVGGQLFSYQNGTTTLQPTYADSTLVTPNANPTILDARASASVWLDPTKNYKLVLQDASGAVQWTQDNVTAGGVVQTNPSAAQTINGQKLIDATGFEGPVGVDTQYPGNFSEVISTASTSKTRMTNIPAVGQAFSANLAADGVSRDVPARWGYALTFDTVNGGVKVRCISPGGTSKDYAPKLTAGADFTAHANTGSTTQNILVSRTVLGNTLGTAGGLRVRTLVNCLAQGAVASQVGLFANGIQIAVFSIASGATGVYSWEIILGNRGATNSQVCYALPTYHGGTPAVMTATVTTPAVNTAVDMVLDIRGTNGQNTDNITIDTYELEIISTFAM